MARRLAAVGNIQQVGDVEIKASCLASEQMIGGGYSYPDPAENVARTGMLSPLVVNASYPSGQNEWTVRIFNPDTSSNGPNANTLVPVFAYCLTGPNVGATIVQSSAAVPPFSASPVSVTCPGSAVVSAGGFAADASDPINFGEGLIIASEPLRDDSGAARGWSVEAYFLQPSTEPTPQVTAFALCTTAGFQAAKPASLNLASPGAGEGDLGGDSLCGKGQWAPGGGYHFGGDPLEGGRYTFENLALDDLSGWHFQSYVIPYQDVMVWATCVKVPST
ncbi:MAG: hypothetical protein ACHQ4J_10395 [Candidatus Binatia bacterium]